MKNGVFGIDLSKPFQLGGASGSLSLDEPVSVDWEQAVRDLERWSVPTPIDDLGPSDVALLEDIAGSSRRSTGQKQVFQSAMEGVGPEQQRERFVDEVLKPPPAVTAEGWIAEGLREYEATRPELPAWWPSPAGEPAAPTAKGGVMPEWGEFAPVFEFFKNRTRPPELADLENPTVLEMAIAEMLAQNAPPEMQSMFRAVPFEMALWRRADENERRMMEWQRISAGEDEELQLMTGMANFKVQERRRSEDMAANTTRIESDERVRLAGIEATNERAMLASTDKQLQNVRMLMTSGNVTPSGARALLSSYGWSDAGISAALGDLQTKFDVGIDKTRAQTSVYRSQVPLNEARTRTEGERAEDLRLRNERNRATMQEQIDQIKAEAARAGLAVEIDAQRLQLLEDEVSHLDDRWVMEVAKSEAQIAHLYAITEKARRSGGAGLSERDKKLGERALNDADVTLRGLESALDGLNADFDEVAKEYREYEVRGGDDVETRNYLEYLRQEMQSIHGARIRMNQRITAAKAARDSAFDSLYPEDIDTEGVEFDEKGPVRPVGPGKGLIGNVWDKVRGKGK